MTAPNTDANPALVSALQRVRSNDEAARQAAMQEVGELLGEDPGVTDVMAVIETAASGNLPPPKYDWQSTDGGLLRTVWGKTTDDHVPVVANRFDQFSKVGRGDALALLAQTETAGATAAFITAVRRYGWPEQSWPAMTNAFEHKALFPELVLPALLDDSIPGLPAEVVDGFLLGYAVAGKLIGDIANAARTRTVRRAKELVATLMPMQQANGIGWRWDEDYAQPRLHAGLALDLLAYMGKTPDVVAVLREAEKLQDPRVKMFAALSLFKLREVPEPKTMQDAAADPESRRHLFLVLEHSPALAHMPASERTQEKLAEADMVFWLTYPTELGRAPDQIELMRAVEIDAGDDGGGVFVYYVFRFRTDEPHWSAKDGWMAGISGPFRKADMPTAQGWGDTFSTFAKWDEFDASEHLRSVRELMQTWREHNARQ